MESIQHKLSRVRSPRVQITYDVEIGGAIVKRELPLIVGILADLSGKPEKELPPLRERKFVEIDRDNFDEVMLGVQPRVTMKVANVFGAADAQTNIELVFQSIEDFSPLSLVKKIPATAKIYQSREYLRDFLAKLDGNDALDGLLVKLLADTALQTELKEAYAAVTDATTGATDFAKVKPSAFMEELLTKGNMALDDSQKPYALCLIGQFTVDILSKDIPEGASDASLLVNDRISEIDNGLSEQINLVLHEESFQRQEATWRGLNFLVMNTETSTQLKLRVLNVAKKDLLKDLQKAVEFDQSSLFKMVYEEEFGTYGGDPFSVLVGDYEFGRHPEDIELLEKISGVAAAAHAPFIGAAYAKLFDLQDFYRLSRPRDLSKIFESAELIKWRSFRDSEDSRYVGLTLPKVLLRLPYGPETVAVEGFDFREDVDGTDASKYLWGNPAYILGQRITNAFSHYSWLAAIRGVEGGGLVEGLPVHTFKTKDGEVTLTCPTQVAITDRREKELNDLGFMAICHCKGSDKAAFFGGQTANLPKKYNTDLANANSRISAMLPYILNASRFAHYIKVIMREKVGSFATKDNVSSYLNNWISQFVLLDDSATQEMKARFPLRAARIDVTDVPGKPGSYRATVFIKPHFQLEELTTSIRLVAELPG